MCTCKGMCKQCAFTKKKKKHTEGEKREKTVTGLAFKKRERKKGVGIFVGFFTVIVVFLCGEKAQVPRKSPSS